MKIVSVNSLGLCEHCGAIFSIQDMPPECLDAVWLCPTCRKELTNESFGYTLDGKKIKWVGPEKQWVNEEPKEIFQLGNFEVLPSEEARLMYTSPFLW